MFARRRIAIRIASIVPFVRRISANCHQTVIKLSYIYDILIIINYLLSDSTIKNEGNIMKKYTHNLLLAASVVSALSTGFALEGYAAAPITLCSFDSPSGWFTPPSTAKDGVKTWSYSIGGYMAFVEGQKPGIQNGKNVMVPNKVTQYASADKGGFQSLGQAQADIANKLCPLMYDAFIKANSNNGNSASWNVCRESLPYPYALTFKPTNTNQVASGSFTCPLQKYDPPPLK